jgi:hypothetical protein
MISAPTSRATWAITSSSVETTVRVILSAASAERTARATSGTPSTFVRFLRGIPLDPPRAGIIAKYSMIISKNSFLFGRKFEDSSPN